MGFASGFAAGSAAVERGLSIKDTKEKKKRKEEFQQRIKDINSAAFEEIKADPPPELGQEPTGLGASPADPAALDASAGLDSGLGGATAPPTAAPAPTRYSFLGTEYDSKLDDDAIQSIRNQRIQDAALEYDVDVGLKYLTETQQADASKARAEVSRKQVDINKMYTEAQIQNLSDRLGLGREQLEEAVAAREAGDKRALQALGISERRLTMEEARGQFNDNMASLNYGIAQANALANKAKSTAQAGVYDAQAKSLTWELERSQNAQYGVELENAVEYLREGDDAGFNNFLESNQEIIQKTFRPPNGAEYKAIKVLTDPAGTGGVAEFYDAEGNRVGSDQFTYDELMSMAKSAQGITGRKNVDALNATLSSTATALRQLDDPTSPTGLALLENFARLNSQVTSLLTTPDGPASNTAAGQGVDIIDNPKGGVLVVNKTTLVGQPYPSREEAERAIQAGDPVPMRQGLR